jgi:hypothetical protein
MTFWLKMLGRLSIRPQGKFILGFKTPLAQAVNLLDRTAVRAVHVARDQVPLRRTLQIRFARLSQSFGRLNSMVENIWRYEWDSSQRLLRHLSAG